MNKLTIFKICFLLSFFFGCISLTTTFLLKFYQTHKKCTVFFDPILNVQYLKELSTLQESFFLNSAKEIHNKIVCQNNNKFIKEVKKIKKPTGIHLIFDAAKPYIKICDSFVMTEQGDILPSKSYIDEVTKSLENIEVTTLSQLDDKSKDFVSSILSLPKTIFEHYKICWIDKTEIILLDKSCKFFCIKTDCKSINESELLTKAQKIKETYAKKVLKKNLWCADVRFKNQIIFYEQPPLS